MKKLLLSGAAAAAAFVVIPAFAQAPAPAPVAPRAHMGHAQNRTEVTQHVQAMFTQLDIDRNGWLTKAEADAGKSQMRERMGKRGERRADHTFEMLDTDRNSENFCFHKMSFLC